MATPANVNINNLNIITFIKDIYLSLKHIDACFTTFKNDIDSRMIKLEGQYETILEKLSLLDASVAQVHDKVSNAASIDSAVEKELLDKMYKLSSGAEETSRLELKPKEMTIANILENGYTMLDINNTLENNPDASNDLSHKLITGYKPVDMSDIGDMNSLAMDISNAETNTNQNKNKNQTLDSLLFD